MICLNCKIKYQPPNRRRPGQRFCSIKCARLFHRLPRVAKVCRHCSKLFTPRPRPRDPRPQLFCSRPCLYSFRRAQKKATPVFGSARWARTVRMSLDYRDWRKAVLKRYGRVCQTCGITKSDSPKTTFFDVDHIKPVTIFPHLIFDVENARILCRPCHRKTDTWGYKAHLLKKTISMPALPQTATPLASEESTAHSAFRKS